MRARGHGAIRREDQALSGSGDESMVCLRSRAIRLVFIRGSLGTGCTVRIRWRSLRGREEMVDRRRNRLRHPRGSSVSCGGADGFSCLDCLRGLISRVLAVADLAVVAGCGSAAWGDGRRWLPARCSRAFEADDVARRAGPGGPARTGGSAPHFARPLRFHEEFVALGGIGCLAERQCHNHSPGWRPADDAGMRHRGQYCPPHSGRNCDHFRFHLVPRRLKVFGASGAWARR